MLYVLVILLVRTLLLVEVYAMFTLVFHQLPWNHSPALKKLESWLKAHPHYNVEARWGPLVIAWVSWVCLCLPTDQAWAKFSASACFQPFEKCSKHHNTIEFS